MLKIRGISNAENLLPGMNRFGHCLTQSSAGAGFIGDPLEPFVRLILFHSSPIVCQGDTSWGPLLLQCADSVVRSSFAGVLHQSAVHSPLWICLRPYNLGFRRSYPP